MCVGKFLRIYFTSYILNCVTACTNRLLYFSLPFIMNNIIIVFQQDNNMKEITRSRLY